MPFGQGGAPGSADGPHIAPRLIQDSRRALRVVRPHDSLRIVTTLNGSGAASHQLTLPLDQGQFLLIDHVLWIAGAGTTGSASISLLLDAATFQGLEFIAVTASPGLTHLMPPHPFVVPYQASRPLFARWDAGTAGVQVAMRMQYRVAELS